VILDVFAVIGGWDEGLRLLGRHDVLGIELDEAACATRIAAGHATLRADAATWPLGALKGRVEGLIASPPCQTFSQAGNRDGVTSLAQLVAHVRSCADGWRDPPANTDPRTTLVLQPLRYALELQPEWVALEQVPDVAPIWAAMAVVLRQHGYSAWSGLLNAADYGVPQTRRRAILTAHKGRTALPPAPTHGKNPTPGLFGTLEPWVSMAQALGWGQPGRVVNPGGSWGEPRST